MPMKLVSMVRMCRGTITSDGADSSRKGVSLYGTTDGGDNPYAWDKQVDLGTYQQGTTYRGRLAGLFVGQQYHFRTAGRNNLGRGGLVWSATKTFSTLSSLSPANLGALSAQKHLISMPPSTVAFSIPVVSIQRLKFLGK